MFTAMRKISFSAITIGSTALVVAGCGGGGAAKKSGSAAQPAAAVPAAVTSAATTARAKSTQRITVAHSSFGPSLFDGKRGALYLFTRDKGSTPSCYGACANAWPPFLAKGGVKPTALRGAKSSLIGTTHRTDGTVQVTYKGKALYYFQGDTPGQLTCGNVQEYGGLWLAVSPAGAGLK